MAASVQCGHLHEHFRRRARKLRNMERRSHRDDAHYVGDAEDIVARRVGTIGAIESSRTGTPSAVSGKRTGTGSGTATPTSSFGTGVRRPLKRSSASPGAGRALICEE